MPLSVNSAGPDAQPTAEHDSSRSALRSPHNQGGRNQPHWVGGFGRNAQVRPRRGGSLGPVVEDRRDETSRRSGLDRARRRRRSHRRRRSSCSSRAGRRPPWCSLPRGQPRSSAARRGAARGAPAHCRHACARTAAGTERRASGSSASRASNAVILRSALSRVTRAPESSLAPSSTAADRLVRPCVVCFAWLSARCKECGDERRRALPSPEPSQRLGHVRALRRTTWL